MQLVDRYLQAVEFWLPNNKQRADIVSELGDDIRAEVEEQESRLGRALTEDETVAVLKKRGRPMLVANRYQPQRSLISPAWYPAYVFALQMAAICYVVPWFLVWMVMHFVFPVVAVTRGFPVAANFGTFWSVLFTTFAVVTLVFAALDRASTGQKFACEWDPRKLPRIRENQRIPRANSTCEILIGAFGCACWLVLLRLPLRFEDLHTRLVFSPWVRGYLWALFALGVASLALSIANWVRPYWTGTRYAVRAGIHLASALVLAAVARRPLLHEFAASKISGAEAATLQHGINAIVSASLMVAIFVVVVMCWLDLMRARRLQAS